MVPVFLFNMTHHIDKRTRVRPLAAVTGSWLTPGVRVIGHIDNAGCSSAKTQIYNAFPHSQNKLGRHTRQMF